MIAIHKYSPPKTGGITLLSEYTLHQLVIYTQFSAGLNGLQVDQVDSESDKRTSTYTQLVASKLVAACIASVQ